MLHSSRRQDHRAVTLIMLFLGSLYILAIASYLGFLPPFGPSLLVLIVGLLVWLIGLSLFWRKRWGDKLLGMEM